jgi:uncharacterized protein YcbX
MPATVAWISFTPVKGLRMHQLEEVEVTELGVPGDRAFFVVEESGKMVSATRLGDLIAVVADYDAEAGTLGLSFPDGTELGKAVELGDSEQIDFFGAPFEARPVHGPFSAALSEQVGRPLRLMAAPPDRSGVDRGPRGAVTLLSVASLERLREQASEADPVDARRFRMTFGIDGLEAHAEDGWVGCEVRLGDAVVRVTGHVGRCAATTRNADTGVVDFKTLHHLSAYRREVEATERLPFGVFAEIVAPGRVRLDDAVSVAPVP